MHIHGRPVDMEAITAIADEAGVPVIEDAAQSQGADIVKADGTVVRAGGYGLAGCFSFFPGKNLGAFGDAGALTTNDDEFAAMVRLLRDHGRTTKYEHVEVGYAHRLDTLQAAVLLAKLSTLDEDNRRRRELAGLYSAGLAGVGDLRLPPETPDQITRRAPLRRAHAAPRRAAGPPEGGRGSTPASTTRSRCTCSRPTPRWATRSATSRWPRRTPASACPCRSTRS